MPLVLFVGLPASGKTTRAKQLLAHLQQHLFPQQITAKDDSNQPDSLTPSTGSLSTSPLPLPPSAPSPTIDESKDDSTVHLSGLSLTGTPAAQPASNDSPSAASSPTVGSTSDAPFTKSKGPAKPSKSSFSTSPPSPAAASSPISELLLINHESLSLPRSTFYSSPQNEKAGRSAIRASVERHLTSSRLLLVDYVNDIKGFRYELWCRAREMGSTYCVVYCDVPRERCVEWNKQRPVEQQYNDTVSGTHTTHRRRTHSEF